MLKEKIFCIVAEFWQIIVHCDFFLGKINHDPSFILENKKKDKVLQELENILSIQKS